MVSGGAYNLGYPEPEGDTQTESGGWKMQHCLQGYLHSKPVPGTCPANKIVRQAFEIYSLKLCISLPVFCSWDKSL